MPAPRRVPRTFPSETGCTKSVREEIQIESVFATGLKIQPVEDGLVVADVVKRTKLRGVEKTPAARTVDSEKVAELRGAVSQTQIAAASAKRPV